jgi:hypothetical protein
VESFYLRSSNQYVFVKVTPSFFPVCENVFVPGKSPVKV